jgi:putative chitinase
MRPIEVVRQVCPRAKPSYLAAIESGDGLFRKAGIITPGRLAHFLAQICHESGGMSIEWESGAYSAERLLEIFGEGNHSAGVTATEAVRLAKNGPAIFERVYGLGNPKKARELGNTNPGDGWKYRGGGLMQTTGRSNYRRMGAKCGVDFEGNPSLVLSAEHALKPALAEWTEGKLNELADSDDLRSITRRINGGLNGLADRQAWYRKIRPIIDKVDLEFTPVKPTPPPDVPKPLPVPKPDHTAVGVVVALVAMLMGVATFVKDHPFWTAVGVALTITAILYFTNRKKP